MFYSLQKSIGTQHIKIKNLFLVPPIRHFMCILTLTSRLASATPFGASCEQSRVNGGIFQETGMLATSSLMTNPLPGKDYISKKEKVQKSIQI